jgi:hypothetical protein
MEDALRAVEVDTSDSLRERERMDHPRIDVEGVFGRLAGVRLTSLGIASP